jgi:hypothetical protein
MTLRECQGMSLKMQPISGSVEGTRNIARPSTLTRGPPHRPGFALSALLRHKRQGQGWGLVF